MTKETKEVGLICVNPEQVVLRALRTLGGTSSASNMAKKLSIAEERLGSEEPWYGENILGSLRALETLAMAQEVKSTDPDQHPGDKNYAITGLGRLFSGLYRPSRVLEVLEKIEAENEQAGGK